MKILVGTHHLKKTGGTENFTFALAVELKRQGHEVEYFAMERGEIAEKFEKEYIPYMQGENYDLVLANHNSVCRHLAGVLKPTKIVQTVHGISSALEEPSCVADEYVAVTEEVREHLLNKGIHSTVILNGIDCERFRPKRKLSQQPQKVLSLCQSKKANRFLEKCCKRIGAELICCNKYKENVWNIEESIQEADIVVGIGRSLYDAMASGRPVVSYDYRSYMGKAYGDGYLTEENIMESLHNNCSGRRYKRQFSVNEFVRELQKYRPEDGTWAREFALQHLNVENAAKQYLALSGEAHDKTCLSGILKETEGIILAGQERIRHLEKRRIFYKKLTRNLIIALVLMFVLVAVLLWILI